MKFLLPIFLLITVFISCSSTGKNNEESYKKAESHYQLGISSLNRGDMLAAKREISIAISYMPETARYHNDLGIAHLNDKELDKAELCFKKAIELEKSYTDPYNNLGVLYMQQKNYTKAKEMFLHVLSDQIYAFPHYAETNLGIIARYEKNYTEAETHFKKAIKISGKYCEAFKEIGILYDEQGESEKAKNYYLKTLDECPSYVEALYRAAIKLLASKNEKQGRLYLAKCLDIDENNTQGFEIPFIKECSTLAKEYGVTATEKLEAPKKEVDGGY